MGNRKASMFQKARRRGPDDGTHRDKYAREKPPRQPAVTASVEQEHHGQDPARPASKPAPVLDRIQQNEARVDANSRALHEESEQVLASLPGGTLEERLRSAQRRLLQDQDAIQSALAASRQKP